MVQTESQPDYLQEDQQPEFECDMCDKRYKCKSSLRKHKKMHESSLKCVRCMKGFSSQTNLDKHMKLHEPYRPVSCNYCDNSFNAEGHLKTHLKRCV